MVEKVNCMEIIHGEEILSFSCSKQSDVLLDTARNYPSDSISEDEALSRLRAVVDDMSRGGGCIF